MSCNICITLSSRVLIRSKPTDVTSSFSLSAISVSIFVTTYTEKNEDQDIRGKKDEKKNERGYTCLC